MIKIINGNKIYFSDRDLNSSGFYDMQFDFELIQVSTVDNLRLSLVRIESSNFGLKVNVTYQVRLIDKFNTVYKVIESNLSRCYYLYDTMHHAMQ